MRNHKNRNSLNRLAQVGLVASTIIAFAACSTTRSTDEQLSDASITTAINAKFAADPEVNPFEIDVDTLEGTVYLRGLVETDAARDEAEDLAETTTGVKDVVNEIELGDLTLSENTRDAILVAQIKTKLAVDPQVAAHNIDVDVDAGVVTLSGVVRLDAQRDEAERLAENVEGVESVRNMIELQ